MKCKQIPYDVVFVAISLLVTKLTIKTTAYSAIFLATNVNNFEIAAYSFMTCLRHSIQYFLSITASELFRFKVSL